MSVTEEELQRRFGRLDADGSGSIDAAEYVRDALSDALQRSATPLEEVLTGMDADGNGDVDKKDARREAFSAGAGVATCTPLFAAVWQEEHDAVRALDAWQITALTPVVTIGGSLVAGLALVEAAFDAGMLWEAVSLDELYQERRWGADSEAQKARAANKRDWDNAVRFLGLL